MRRHLSTALRWLAVVLVLRVLAAVLANYPDYFPPDFDALFLQGREATFAGAYRVAFYGHIFSAPVVLVAGLVLMSGYWLRRRRLHRVLGRVYVGVLLGVMLTSAAAMARHAFGGWPAGVSFLLLTAATAVCAVLGVAHARAGRLDRHRVWMTRCYLLVCSAVALRIISGAAGLVGVADPERAYVAAAWASWLGPLAGYESVRRAAGRRPGERRDVSPPVARPVAHA